LNTKGPADLDVPISLFIGLKTEYKFSRTKLRDFYSKYFYQFKHGCVGAAIEGADSSEPVKIRRKMFKCTTPIFF